MTPLFNSRITTDYDLNLKWYDPRLIFRNLKPDETFNDLGKAAGWNRFNVIKGPKMVEN